MRAGESAAAASDCPNGWGMAGAASPGPRHMHPSPPPTPRLSSPGAPPYYDLQPLSALYNIVQDPHPPLPADISTGMRDFLLQCFRKVGRGGAVQDGVGQDRAVQGAGAGRPELPKDAA